MLEKVVIGIVVELLEIRQERNSLNKMKTAGESKVLSAGRTLKELWLARSK